MVTVKQRFIHTPARKLRLIADVIRGASIEKAHNALAVMPKTGAKTMDQIVRSAESAARQGKLEGPLMIHAIYVDEGPALKRRVLAGRGRATSFEHRMSHVTLTVAEHVKTAPKAKPVKPEKKA